MKNIRGFTVGLFFTFCFVFLALAYPFPLFAEDEDDVSLVIGIGTQEPESLEDVRQEPTPVIVVPSPTPVVVVEPSPTPRPPVLPPVPTSTPRPPVLPPVPTSTPRPPVVPPTPTATPRPVTCRPNEIKSCGSSFSQLSASSQCTCVPRPTPTITPRPPVTPPPPPPPPSEPRECNFFRVRIREHSYTDDYKHGSSMLGAGADKLKRLSCMQAIAARCDNPNWQVQQFAGLQTQGDGGDDCIAANLISYPRFDSGSSNKVYGDFYKDRNAKATTAFATAQHIEEECSRSNTIADCTNWQGRVRELIESGKRFQRELNANSGGVVYDKQCRAVSDADPNQICDAELHTRISPVSLIWDKGSDLNDEVSVVNFILNPYAENKWYAWKASKNAPLLVYDPEKKGIIKDAKQLFGDWTFGGKKLASLDAKEKVATKWRHGFEALATLDYDQDGQVSGLELKDLSLWFDKNRDGVSDLGEVVDIRKMGVVALYYQVDEETKDSKDLYLKTGYQRILDGKLVIGEAVDWYGEESDSKLDIISDLVSKGQLAKEDKEVEHFRETKDIGLSKFKTDFSGLWKWELEDQKNSLGEFSLLQIEDRGFFVNGVSLSELPVNSEQSEVKSAIERKFFYGEKEVDSRGRESLKFSLSYQGVKLESIAYLDQDGKTLFGETTAHYIQDNKQASVVYRWRGTRM